MGAKLMDGAAVAQPLLADTTRRAAEKMNEALSRYKQHQGIGGSISTSLFLKSCLDGSRPTAGFCDDGPRPLSS